MLDPEAFKKLVGLVTQVVSADPEVAQQVSRQVAADAKKAVQEAWANKAFIIRKRRPIDCLIEQAMAPDLPRVTERQWNGLLEVREVLEEGLTTDDPKKLKAILKRADDLVSRLIGSSVIEQHAPPGREFRVEPLRDHGLEANLTRLFEWIGLSHEEARENAWDLADAIREAELEKMEEFDDKDVN